MKIYELNLFDKVKDPVKTEETLYRQLLEKKDEINTDRVYVALPIAERINQFGLVNTQKEIKQLSNSIKKPFYICQHIQASHLNFGNNALVFSPHATINDNFIPIPHYSVNVASRVFKPQRSRKWKMSFQGSFRTHWTRMRLYNTLKDRKDCYINNTGEWFFEKNEKQKRIIPDYKKLLEETEMALCPRGTGPSTIRFWEALGSGCLPLLISDSLKLPLEDVIDWTRLMIKIPEKDIENIDNYLPDKMSLFFMRTEAQRLYQEWFSNENLYKTITHYLQNEGMKKYGEKTIKRK